MATPPEMAPLKVAVVGVGVTILCVKGMRVGVALVIPSKACSQGGVAVGLDTTTSYGGVTLGMVKWPDVSVVVVSLPIWTVTPVTGVPP